MKEILTLCSQHQKQYKVEFRKYKIEITSELYKCKRCTQCYPIHVDCSKDGETKHFTSLANNVNKISYFKPPPNITFKPTF